MSIWLEISDLEVPLVPGPSDSKVLMTFHSALGAQSHRVGNEVQDLSSSGEWWYSMRAKCRASYFEQIIGWLVSVPAAMNQNKRQLPYDLEIKEVRAYLKPILGRCKPRKPEETVCAHVQVEVVFSVCFPRSSLIFISYALFEFFEYLHLTYSCQRRTLGFFIGPFS